MKTKKLFFIGWLISVFLLGSILCIIPISTQTKITSNSNNVNAQENIESSQFANIKIRIAIYTETNTTTPSYAFKFGEVDTDYLGLWYILERGNYDLMSLTANDICNHKLKTADYDIFIIPNNIPRENTTNLIKEFWLGGGGILSFDHGINYICYSGMMIPDSLGSNGSSKYWKGVGSDYQNITVRHSVSKSYNPDDQYQEYYSSHGTFNWTVLQKTSIASELIKFATPLNNPRNVTALARNPLNRGGRVVHLACRCNSFLASMDNLVLDTIEWLCPHPKGRILFDLSHKPYYGLDSWDSIYVQSISSYYSILRNNLINRSYTLDKLYPSISGNLTVTNLASYDLLWIDYPEINFTGNEVSSVSSWIHNGGGLLVIGDIGSAPESKNINFLLSQLNLILNTTESGSGAETFTKFEHSTVEGCSQIGTVSTGLINYTGNAFPIWGTGLNRVVVAGQEYGDGRVILIADGAVLRDSSLQYYSHRQYSINVVNWLTSGKAKALVYVNYDINDNLYRGPVATALNDLGIKFYLTFDFDYFNMSLTEENWNIVIIDHQKLPQQLFTYYSDILNYMKTGGRLILSTFQYLTLSPYDQLWSYLGFKSTGDTYSATPPTIYLWGSTTHPIFNTPAPYGTNYISTTQNYLTTDCTNLTIYNNATAIAFSQNIVSYGKENAAIIIGANGRAITNAMILSEYSDDSDYSTYSDALEIWENEINFLMPSSSPGVPSGDGGNGGGGGNGKKNAIPGYNPLILLMVDLFAIIAISFKLTKKRINI